MPFDRYAHLRIDPFAKIPESKPVKTEKKTEPDIAQRTKEEKKQRENDRKREQKERRAARRELETSNVGLTSTAANDTPTLPATPASSSQPPLRYIDPTISTPSPATCPISPTHPQPTYLEAQFTHVLPAATFISVPPSVLDIPPVPQSIFDDYRELLDEREEDFLAANDADHILEGLLSLALSIGWRAGWQLGRESGISSREGDGRREAVIQGRHDALAEARTQPPATIREFTTVHIQTDAAAAVILPQESSPSLAMVADTIVPLAIPFPRDLTALQTGSPHPFGTLQRRLARSRRSHGYAQKKSVSAPTHPIVTRRHPHGIASNKPFLTTPVSLPPHPRARRQHQTLDWDHDPLLSDLSRALGALGWIRKMG
ncbi:hypothetical protein B0H19DRAFT_240592 [Mycena capillaripes]|nr:hypothetical protein B0H19DRAFT_240592 [Mycena capillaripes]